jgi:transketolase
LPDVFVVNSVLLPYFVRSGLVAKVENAEGDFVPVASQAAKFDDQLYGVPQYTYANYLSFPTSIKDKFANVKDVLDLVGLADVDIHGDPRFFAILYFLEYHKLPQTVSDVKKEFVNKYATLFTRMKPEAEYWESTKPKALLSYTEAYDGRKESDDTTVQVLNFNGKPIFFVDLVCINSKLSGDKLAAAKELVSFMTSKSFFDQVDSAHKRPSFVAPARKDVLDAYTQPLYKQLSTLVGQAKVDTPFTFSTSFNKVKKANHAAVEALTNALCINQIRILAAEVVQKANSGHPGMPMGMAPVAHVLFDQFLHFNPKDLKWLNRDRWILSNGHGSALQYVMLHLIGGGLTMDDLKSFRQVGSKTPGHPESHMTAGVEITTGPLGQGLSNAVGMAIAQEHFKGKVRSDSFDPLDHHIYTFCGDGCLMEGVTSEACSLAGHLGLGSLIVLYDDNKITIDGSTSIAFTEDVGKRFDAYGWHVQHVEKGDDDVDAISRAIKNAQTVTDKPSIICLRTTIGFGSKKQGTHGVHGAPLGWDDIKYLKSKWGFDPEAQFTVDKRVSDRYKHLATISESYAENWKVQVNQHLSNENKKQIDRLVSGDILPKSWDFLPKFTPQDKPVATRKLSEAIIKLLGKEIDELVGGSADLAASNLTKFDKDFQKGSRDGKNICFGVREHGMAAICNGISGYAPGILPYCATFLNFVGYMAGASRLSSLTGHQILYVMTHDSIGLGEDGPTHQPIEIVPMLRATPNTLVFRPADGNETSGAYKLAIENRHRPSFLCLSRQDLPQLEGSSIEAVAKGGYVLNPEVKNPAIVLVATGSEVSIIVEAAKALANELEVRLVSMPSCELFDEQSEEYRNSVLTPNGKVVPVMSVEAMSVRGWEKYSHIQFGMVTFGSSGPYKDVYKKFGITAENLAKKSKQVVEYYKNRPLSNLVERLDLFSDLNLHGH